MREEAASQWSWLRGDMYYVKLQKERRKDSLKEMGRSRAGRKHSNHPRVIRSLMVEFYSLWPLGQANGESLKKKGMKIASVIMMMESRMSLPANAR